MRALHQATSTARTTILLVFLSTATVACMSDPGAVADGTSTTTLTKPTTLEAQHVPKSAFTPLAGGQWKGRIKGVVLVETCPKKGQDVGTKIANYGVLSVDVAGGKRWTTLQSSIWPEATGVVQGASAQVDGFATVTTVAGELADCDVQGPLELHTHTVTGKMTEVMKYANGKVCTNVVSFVFEPDT